MEPYEIMYVKNTRFSRLCSRRISRLISRNYDASPYYLELLHVRTYWLAHKNR